MSEPFPEVLPSPGGNRPPAPKPTKQGDSGITVVARPFVYGNKDSAAFLVKDSGRKFQRPWIKAGGLKYTWPIGIEGFRVSGTMLTALHRYIGDNVAVADTIHFNEGHIEISGMLPGMTSPGSMVKLIDVLMARNKKTLSLPGVLPKVQYVVVENYDFSHTEDDRTSSITYTISMIRTGNVGTSKGSGGSGGGGSTFGAVQGVSGAPTGSQRSVGTESPRTFATTQSVDTFRAVADAVYGDVDQWPKLVDLNRDRLVNNNPSLTNVNTYQLPYFRWPVGTKIVY
jgi:hypothetical protein